MKVGDKVVWLDPDNTTSCIVTIKEIREDTVLCADEHTELEALISELKPFVDTYCCKKCGNIDVQEKAWVYSNTFSYADCTEDDSQAWCDECSSHTTIISVEEFLNNKNNENNNRNT